MVQSGPYAELAAYTGAEADRLGSGPGEVSGFLLQAVEEQGEDRLGIRRADALSSSI